MTWDYLGREATSTQIERDTGSGTAAYTTNYVYDDSTNGGGFLSQVTSPDGVSTGYAYDPAGELAQVTDGAGNVTSYSYDSLGRQAAVSYPDGTSQVTGYDGAGNVTSVKQLDASGNTLTTTSATFDGEGDKLSATGANGNTTTFTYDPTGMVSQEVQPVSASSGITTSFGYDAAGNQTRYTDGNGNSWWDTYNSWSLQASRVEPATSQHSSTTDSTFTTAYDGDGNPATVTEPGGVTVTDSYNNLEELTGQSGAGADAATPTRSFGYDAAGNLTSASTSGTNATSESFAYNDRGEALTASGSGGSTSYGYNGDGQVTSVADAAGTTSYGYDSAGRLGTLADPASGITATYSYNNDDQVSGVSYGSGGDTQSFGYDSLHRLTSETLKTGSGTTVASVGYGYNPDGQVTSMATAGLAGPSSSTYSYDEAGRLTSWNNGTTTTNYGYDADGNLTQDGTKTYTYDARDELTSDGTNSYTYTARGTPSSESSPSGSVAVTFDAYGDQASAGSQSYGYDALGRLVSDQPSGSGTGYTFSYAGKTGTIAADGAATYTWDPSGSTLVGTGGPSGGSGVLALTDAHGDVLGQFAPNATAMSGSEAFDPWGAVTATAGSLLGGAGFQSAWTDPATGKDLMGARWYSPSAGDFTSADTMQVSPVPDPAAGNPYAYAADDPLVGTDPTGHLVAMLPDGGNYYRAPAPAKPVASPPPPPPPSAQQAVQAFTNMIHSMGKSVPADAHMPTPALKTTAKPKAAAKPKVAAQSSLDACSGNMTACLAGYIRYNGGQVNQQGVVTLTGYHPGPANPGTCDIKVCYNVLTGQALKPSLIPTPPHQIAATHNPVVDGTPCNSVASRYAADGPCIVPKVSSDNGFDLSWAGWSTFINYASGITTTAAVATAWIPGVGEVTGGVAMVTDAAAGITNGINSLQALQAHHYETAAWDMGSAALGFLGLGAAGRSLRALSKIEVVRSAASDVAESSIGPGLIQLQDATSLAERMAASQAVRSAATNFIQVGGLFDQQAEIADAMAIARENQAWMLSLGGLNYALEECARGECG